MPTVRPRHLLTETDDIAAAIDAAAPLFPGESRADVLRHLVALGAAQVRDAHDGRRRTVRELAGLYSGLFPTEYLDDLRADWPE
jgi:hypothetical protein